MRRSVTRQKLKTFMEELAKRAQGPGRVYFVGGASALLLGIREQTIDVDLKLDPEPKGVFEAIASLKESLDLNVELASPDDFIPVTPDWRERSMLVETIGKVSFFHFDFYGQALAKIERGYAQDLADAKEWVKRGLINADGLRQQFEAIRPALIRYPAIDAGNFERKVQDFLASLR